LNNISRIYYLSKKYTKKWLSFHINNKQPINTSDLELNSLNLSNFEKYINYIDYKNRQHYLFTVNDFTSLIRTNLENCYTYDVIPEPLNIKNPYTNNIFTKEELTDINCKYSRLTQIPLIWHMFINCGYDVTIFRETHYQYLLNLCIPSFVDKLEDIDIIYYLDDMFAFLFCKKYCTDCIRERKYFRDKKIRNVLIYWIHSIKLEKEIDLSKIDIVLKLYDINCKIHNPIEELPVQKKIKMIGLDNSILVKDIYDTGEHKQLFIDFTYPFVFSIGTYTKEDRRRYKNKLREKNRFKKRQNSKTI
jgi:hypothetical protein